MTSRTPTRLFLTMRKPRIIQVDPISRAGRFLHGGHPCTTTTLPTPNGRSSSLSSPTATTTARRGTPGATTAPWSTEFCGTCTPAPPGPMCPNATAPGKRSTTASTAGAGTATWARVLDALLLRLDDEGLIDRDLWCIDASVIR